MLQNPNEEGTNSLWYNFVVIMVTTIIISLIILCMCVCDWHDMLFKKFQIILHFHSICGGLRLHLHHLLPLLECPAAS